MPSLPELSEHPIGRKQDRYQRDLVMRKEEKARIFNKTYHDEIVFDFA
jgi:hypothetical protein